LHRVGIAVADLGSQETDRLANDLRLGDGLDDFLDNVD